jgi:hypothetical protein
MLQSGKNNLIVDISVAQSMFEQRCMMSQGQSSAEPDIPYTSANLVPNSNENTVTYGPTVEPTLSLSLSLGLPVPSATSNQATNGGKHGKYWWQGYQQLFAFIITSGWECTIDGNDSPNGKGGGATPDKPTRLTPSGPP